MTSLKIAAIAGLVPLAPVAGFAGLEFCNDTEARQTVAVG
ncbi:MAG: hypothetical protein ACI8R4_000847 [Paracoccaceae bacterium]|jgi:hypothetical protein